MSERLVALRRLRRHVPCVLELVGQSPGNVRKSREAIDASLDLLEAHGDVADVMDLARRMGDMVTALGKQIEAEIEQEQADE